ncbi:alcohol dehydrogenase [Lachnospiraceae bacterium C7]|nr:alcohol dehydrogenase [Lachnospiraceae bacterium C7]
MNLYMPTSVYCEKNCVTAHADEFKKLGTRAMIVTGKHSSRANGSLQDVCRALDSSNIPYVIFDEIEANPSVETVVKAANIAKKENVDFFIGIGGGSPMDASKAISLLTKNTDKDEHILYEQVKLDYYPVAEVPTTSGTGSEVTPYAILTLHEKHTKKSIAHRIYPAVAFVDYTYLKTSNRSGFISTCVDALAHLIESYLNTNANEYNRMYAREGFRLWGSVKNSLVPCMKPENGSNESLDLSDEEYETFMHASLIAGMAITHTGTSLPHGLSYPVTYELGVPHGKAVGIFLPGFLRNYEDKSDVHDVLDALGFSSISSFETYIRTIIGEVEIPIEIWETDKKAILQNPAKLKNYPFEMTAEILATYR